MDIELVTNPYACMMYTCHHLKAWAGHIVAASRLQLVRSASISVSVTYIERKLGSLRKLSSFYEVHRAPTIGAEAWWSS